MCEYHMSDMLISGVDVIFIPGCLMLTSLATLLPAHHAALAIVWLSQHPVLCQIQFVAT